MPAHHISQPVVTAVVPVCTALCNVLCMQLIQSSFAPSHFVIIIIVLYYMWRSDRRSVSSSPNKITHGVLPAPIHVGKHLREKRVDFRLPYDVWWLHNSGAVGVCFFQPVVMMSMSQFVAIIVCHICRQLSHDHSHGYLVTSSTCILICAFLFSSVQHLCCHFITRATLCVERVFARATCLSVCPLRPVLYQNRES